LRVRPPWMERGSWQFHRVDRRGVPGTLSASCRAASLVSRPWRCETIAFYRGKRRACPCRTVPSLTDVNVSIGITPTAALALDAARMRPDVATRGPVTSDARAAVDAPAIRSPRIHLSLAALEPARLLSSESNPTGAPALASPDGSDYRAGCAGGASCGTAAFLGALAAAMIESTCGFAPFTAAWTQSHWVVSSIDSG